MAWQVWALGSLKTCGDKTVQPPASQQRNYIFVRIRYYPEQQDKNKNKKNNNTHTWTIATTTTTTAPTTATTPPPPTTTTMTTTTTTTTTTITTTTTTTTKTNYQHLMHKTGTLLWRCDIKEPILIVRWNCEWRAFAHCFVADSSKAHE